MARENSIVRASLRTVILKSSKMTFMTIVIFLFFITCTIINFIQLLNYIIFHFTFPNIGRHINRHLESIILSQNTTVLKWQCNVYYRLYFADQESMDSFGEEYSLVIGNHCFQLDGIFYWLCCELTHTLGRSKAFAKYDLRWMPIIGWTFYLGEFIMLRRNWNEDSKNIGPSIDRLMEHPYPNLILLLPEGTRYTPEKYQAAMRYARENNIDIKLKHHLVPRVRGFTTSLEHLQKNHKNFSVFSMQHVVREDGDEPNIGNMIAGKTFKVDCYIQKIDNSKLPAADASEETRAKFLYSLFEHMDEITDIHRKYHMFPRAILHKLPVHWYLVTRFILLNFGMSGSLIGYFIYLAIISQSIMLRIVIYGIIFFVFAAIFLILFLLQNSKYGSKKKSG